MHVALTIKDFLDRGETVYPERVAIVDEPGTAGSLGEVTFAEMGDRARGLAAHLDERGVERGERVAILSPNCGRVLLSMFGTCSWGRVLVPINFRLGPDEVRYIVGHSGAKILLVDPEYLGVTEGLDVERVVMDGVADAEFFDPRPGVEPEPWAADEAATGTINYTSGTTARPKGVQLTHRNLWLNSTVFGLHVAVTDRDVYLHTLPMFHCNGWGMPFVLAGMGVKQVALRKVDGEEILRRIERHSVSLLCGAPAVVAAVLDAAAKRRAGGEEVPGGDKAVRIVVAGAPPPSRTIERVEEELGWEFIQLYGLTETTPVLTFNRATIEHDKLDPVERAKRLSQAGPPALGVRVKVDDQGEVLAQSNHVFEGYWEQPEATAAALAGGWFHTGDGGHLDGPSVVIADRKKDVIITGGENVSSIEVEDCLYGHPAVAEAAVIGVPDEKWGETIKALVVLKPGAAATEQDLIAHCRDRMAHYKCPTSVETRDRLERTATGKLQKFKLRQPYWEGRERLVN